MAIILPISYDQLSIVDSFSCLFHLFLPEILCFQELGAAENVLKLQAVGPYSLSLLIGDPLQIAPTKWTLVKVNLNLADGTSNIILVYIFLFAGLLWFIETHCLRILIYCSVSNTASQLHRQHHS